MLEANSKHIGSPSSSLANAFLKATGIHGVLSKKVSTPTAMSSVKKEYVNKVRDYARSKGGWSKYADGLQVSIDENDRVSVSFDGSDEDRQMVEWLEYGTSDSPPQSVMRVMEEEIRQDYLQDKGKFRL